VVKRPANSRLDCGLLHARLGLGTPEWKVLLLCDGRVLRRGMKAFGETKVTTAPQAFGDC
jgi:hypothetical protein